MINVRSYEVEIQMNSSFQVYEITYLYFHLFLRSTYCYQKFNLLNNNIKRNESERYC